MKTGKAHAEEQMYVADKELHDAAMAFSIENHHVFTELTPEEIALWEPLFQPYIEDWIADYEKAGWPTARVVYEAAKEIAVKTK